ncbi:hypothetical protein MHYP_G00337370 [Metynnis hypsauchen]
MEGLEAQFVEIKSASLCREPVEKHDQQTSERKCAVNQRFPTDADAPFQIEPFSFQTQPDRPTSARPKLRCYI